VAVTLSTSVVSITILPSSTLRDDPAGTAAFVTISTSWLASLFAPALLAVSELRVTVTVT